MRRLALWIEHHGAPYQGFQSQGPSTFAAGPSAPRTWAAQETVQQELECKLAFLLQRPVRIWGSGRTDRGVHATCQVVAFDLPESKWTCQSLQRALNAVVHPSVRILKVLEVDRDFHPRFSACRRTYHYYVWPEAPSSSPFFAGLCHLLPEALDIELMRQAALPLLGSHDFQAYARKPEPGHTTVRNLEQLKIDQGVVSSGSSLGPWAQLQSWITFEVVGNAFLRRMVRQLVANLVEVGKGRWPVNRPFEILLSKDPTLGAAPLSPQGLYLVDIAFAPAKQEEGR